jgi:hypothetical protein
MENNMKRWIWLFAAVALAACSDSTEPDDDGVREGDLTFLRFESSNAVTVRQASFWAERGDSRKLEIDYPNGDEFLEFEVRDESLLRRPDGTLFQEGDSVLITVSLDPSNRIIVDFQPSGLIFNPLDPPRLRINFEAADDDIDDDGDLDAEDQRLAAGLAVWQQERPGLPWLPLLSLRLDEDRMEARVLSFTGFAMASN